jgi:hypothetical protein
VECAEWRNYSSTTNEDANCKQPQLIRKKEADTMDSAPIPPACPPSLQSERARLKALLSVDLTGSRTKISESKLDRRKFLRSSKSERKCLQSSKSVSALDRSNILLSLPWLQRSHSRSSESSEKVDESYFDLDKTSEGTRIADDLCNFLKANSLQLPEVDDGEQQPAGEASTDEETSEETNSQEAWSDDSDDDSMEMECQKLAQAEELLRQELNFENAMCSRTGENANEDAQKKRKSASRAIVGYTLFDHCTFLELSEMPKAGFVCDVSEYLANKSRAALSDDAKEFCQPPTNDALASIYFGLEGGSKERLPFRTLRIRIRPDVFCGAVMGAVCATIALSSTHRSHLLKRQGGHVRAVVITGRMPYMVDAQLCIMRKANYERHLLLRLYHASDAELAEVEYSDEAGHYELALDDIPMNLHLKEACALVQLIKNKQSTFSGKKNKSWVDAFFSSREQVTSPRAASAYLHSAYHRSVSTLIPRRHRLSISYLTPEPSVIFPSLSSEDWPMLQASWYFCDKLWHRLSDTFTYSSLMATPIGANSQTVDVHYCMQLSSMLEERVMLEAQHVVDKLKKQVDLAEETNQIFTELTESKFGLYGLEEMEESMQMNIFHQETTKCEDELEAQRFESVAKEALEASEFQTGEKSESQIEDAEEVVRIVVSAYTSHHNRVQNERVRCNNVIVMNQLFQKQFWLHETYKLLRNSYKSSKVAMVESTSFLEVMQKAENRNKEKQHDVQMLPLSEFEADGGKCYITATHILFTIHRRFQKPRILIYDLREIEVRHPSSTSLQLMIGDEIVHRFRPPVNSYRLKRFINILQFLREKDVGEEEEESDSRTD